MVWYVVLIILKFAVSYHRGADVCPHRLLSYLMSAMVYGQVLHKHWLKNQCMS